MTSSIAQNIPTGVSLKIKVLGEVKYVAFESVSLAADHAITLISSGKAIPKSISLDGEIIMDEADINLYWESSRWRPSFLENGLTRIG